MNVFNELADKVRIINPVNIFIEFAKQREINDNVIRTIQKRLFEKGITGDNVKLQTDSSGAGEVYAPITIILKERDNLPTKIVTLFDTSEFYNSMVTLITKQYYLIEGDFQKDDGHISENFTQQFSTDEKFEESVLMLSEREIIDVLIEEYLIFFEQKVNEIFQI